MDLVTTNTIIEELQLNLTNVNLLDDDDGLSYDGGDVQENSTIYEETKLFNESNVEEYCISSDSTICDLTEPFEFREAVNQKKIDDSYLRIAEPDEMTMLFTKESEKVTTGGICESDKVLVENEVEVLVEDEEKIFRKKASCNQCYNQCDHCNHCYKEFSENSLKSHMESIKCRCSNAKRPLDETTPSGISIKRLKYSS